MPPQTTAEEPATTDAAEPAAAQPPVADGMRPIALAFAIANGLVVALFLGLVMLGHVDTGLPGLDLGFQATAAPSGR